MSVCVSVMYNREGPFPNFFPSGILKFGNGNFSAIRYSRIFQVQEFREFGIPVRYYQVFGIPVQSFKLARYFRCPQQRTRYIHQTCLMARSGGLRGTIARIFLTTLWYSQLSNKWVGWNKRIGWNFFFKFNKRVGKIWCCLPVKCPQIGESRLDFCSWKE